MNMKKVKNEKEVGLTENLREILKKIKNSLVQERRKKSKKFNKYFKNLVEIQIKII